MGNFNNYYKDKNGNEHRDIPLGTSPGDAYTRTNMKLKKEVERIDTAIQETNEHIDEEIARVDETVENITDNVSRQLESAVNYINDTIDVVSDSVNTRISSEVAGINSRVDNIIAHNNNTEGNSELIDIRSGADGNIYASAGNAVRSQIAYANNKLSNIDNAMQFFSVFDHSEEKNGYFCAGIFTENSGYRSKVYDVTSLRGKTVYVNTYVYTQYLAVISFYTLNMELISEEHVLDQKYYADYSIKVPITAVYATLTTKIGLIDGQIYSANSMLLKFSQYVDVNQLKLDLTTLYQKVYNLKPIENLNNWYGKKVVWLGTSVSFGANSTKSYANEVSDALGFELVNASVPGQAIHTTANGGIISNGSTCLSVEEYQTLGITISESPISYTPGGNYNNYYRTYEHIFTQENADADLWVFDVFPNNTDFSSTDWNAFDRGQWKYSDNSAFSEHRSTFYGALLFLLDKLYQLNPNARVVFVIGSAFKLSEARAAVETLSTTALHYPFIDLWCRINSNVKTNTYLYSNNGTDMHPSTKAHELMGKMLIGEFLKLA